MEADPVWPVLALAAFQLGDGIACAIPTRFITAALDRVGCPARLRPVLPVLKLASAAGLLAGLWLPGLGLLTIAALVGYFVVAVAFHVRAHDTALGTAGAVGMLAAVVAVGTCF